MADERDDQDKPKSYKTDPDKVKSNGPDGYYPVRQSTGYPGCQRPDGGSPRSKVQWWTNRFHVDGRDLITNALSADYFKEEVELTATAMESLIMTRIYNRPISVLYIKENGEKRLLRGRYIDPARSAAPTWKIWTGQRVIASGWWIIGRSNISSRMVSSTR
jgi:hypothetical protein